MRVESTTDPLELGAAPDLVAGVDDVAAGVDLLEYELAIANVPAIKASGTSHSTLDLKEGSCGIDAGLRHGAYAIAVQALVAPEQRPEPTLS